jgi:isopenicillin N synthase-like dioxygenase
MPHKEEHDDFNPDEYPPFPDGLATVELQTISLGKLLSGDGKEQERVFEECKGRGFFYLELGGTESGETILRDADEIARVGVETFKLPLEEKMKYKWGGVGRNLFGYKYVGATAADNTGTRDTTEFLNVAKNDSKSFLLPIFDVLDPSRDSV